MRDPAPLYTDAMALNVWLIGNLGGQPRPLSQRICTQAMVLLEAITLALRGRDRDRQIERADEALIALRVLLRLAEECGHIEGRQHQHLTPRLEVIGKQLGGWRRALGPV